MNHLPKRSVFAPTHRLRWGRAALIQAITKPWWSLCAVGAFCLLLPPVVQAELVWHCSRFPRVTETVSADQPSAEAEMPFQIATLSNTNVVGISLKNLMDVYSGVTVYIDEGKPLMACFRNDGSAISRAALASLGLNEDTMMALARKSSIARSHLEWVSDEVGMQRCMRRNYPAVGYFKGEQDIAEVAPCF